MAKERIIVLDVNRRYYDIKEAADTSMTVAELIEELRYLPEDCKVVFRNDGGYTYGYLRDRFIDSEYLEPEEEEDFNMDRDDMVYDIIREVEAVESRVIRLNACWNDASDVEFTAVGFNDSRVLGVSTDDEEFIPIEELTGSEVEEVWKAVMF